MYGTIFRFQPKAGSEAELLRQFNEEVGASRLPGAGMKASYVFKLDNGGYMGVAVFDSKEKYVANANDPRQDEWYRKFRALLDADPEWNDGEVVASA